MLHCPLSGGKLFIRTLKTMVDFFLDVLTTQMTASTETKEFQKMLEFLVLIANRMLNTALFSPAFPAVKP